MGALAVHSPESTLSALEKYDIDQSTLAEWEQALNLSIPIDEQGTKRYSPHHINLFKNIRKHLALGRTLGQIKEMITLPPTEQARPSNLNANGYTSPGYASVPETQARVNAPIEQTTINNTVNVTGAAAIAEPRPQVAQAATVSQVAATSPAEPANVPTITSTITTDKIPTQSPMASQQNALLGLVERLMSEKDQLGKKLMETEKLNSHLYNANAMFHRKVKEHAQDVKTLQTQLATAKTQQEDVDPIRHLDDKARLHRQLLDMEKHLLTANQQVVLKEQSLQQQQHHIALLEQRIKDSHKHVPASAYVGTWQERAQLAEVVYDSFGINFEAERNQTLNIPQPPQRLYGNAVILSTQYDYEANPMWKRNETLMLAYEADNTMSGELITEFLLDGVPVGKAIYQVHCQRLA
jgi:DNA-binding transcriptional MerR regulator